MKRLALFALCSACGCAPEQPAETTSCNSVSDCEIGQVCDAALRECVDEPDNRFLGRFFCTIENTAAQTLELSEIVGRIDDDRWSLPSALCTMANNHFTGVFFTYSSGHTLKVRAPVSDLADGRTELGPAIGLSSGEVPVANSASVEDINNSIGYGYSSDGFLELSDRPALGVSVEGYLDVHMFPVVDEDVLFGEPCPRGRADCGEVTAQAGGAQFCDDLVNGPVCSRSCDANGDCSVGDGVCLFSEPDLPGFCTRPCASNADCTPPLECVEGNPDEGSGCF